MDAKDKLLNKMSRERQELLDQTRTLRKELRDVLDFMRRKYHDLTHSLIRQYLEDVGMTRSWQASEEIRELEDAIQEIYEVLTKSINRFKLLDHSGESNGS